MRKGLAIRPKTAPHRSADPCLPVRQPRAVIAESAPDESFGEQIKEAAEKKQGGLPTQKQHKEQAERERSRYPQPRKSAKGG